MEELESLSLSSISAMKMVQAQQEAGVRVIKGINEQSKEIASILFQGLSQVPAPSPDPGKGNRVNIVA